MKPWHDTGREARASGPVAAPCPAHRDLPRRTLIITPIRMSPPTLHLLWAGTIFCLQLPQRGAGGLIPTAGMAKPRSSVSCPGLHREPEAVRALEQVCFC